MIVATVNDAITSQEADALILVYDLSRPETLSRLGSHWLPLIQTTIEQSPGGPPPVVIAGNKVRSSSSSSNGPSGGDERDGVDGGGL